jgi:hypothetical protein
MSLTKTRVTVNEQGHVTDVKYKTYDIKDSTYELSGATVNVTSENLDEKGNKKYAVTITDTLTNTYNEDPAGTSGT